jgi:hypothetical protein
LPRFSNRLRSLQRAGRIFATMTRLRWLCLNT